MKVQAGNPMSEQGYLSHIEEVEAERDVALAERDAEREQAAIMERGLVRYRAALERIVAFVDPSYDWDGTRISMRDIARAALTDDA